MKKFFSLSVIKLFLVTTLVLQSIGVGPFLFPLTAIPVAQAAGATRTWDGGGGDNNASTAANWSSDTAPVAGDDVVFDSTSTKNCTWNISAATTFASFSINSGYTGTISLSTSLNLTGAYTQAAGTFTFSAASVVVTAGASSSISGGTINQAQEPAGSSATATRGVSFNVTGDLNYSAGTISVNGLGFPSVTGTTGSGPAPGTNTLNAGGGGNGGDGGHGGSNDGGGVSGVGSITAPVTAGSSGSSRDGSSPSGAGGGTVKLVASGTLTVGGNITANGGNGTSNGGGGAGGSIWLAAGTLAGSGSITANGGTPGNSNGGGGGGGKIAYTYTSKSYNGTITAYGGAPGATNGRGAAGTIFSKAAAATNGDLLIDNNSNASVRVTRSVATQTFDNITLQNAGNFTTISGHTVTLATAFTSGSSTSTLTVNSGGSFNASALSSLSGAPGTIANAGTFTLPSTITIPSGMTFTNTGTLSGVSSLTMSGTAFSTSTALTLTTLSITSGTFTIAGNVTITVNGNVTVSGGTITQSQEPAGSSTTATRGVVFAVSGNFDLQSGGTISVNSLGFPSILGAPSAGSGPAPGGLDNNAPGGANGGDGGHGSGNALGGTSGIGSVSAPVTAGSSGASRDSGSPSGAGGGTVKLSVTGTLTVSGNITANGGSGTSNGGGGAGGSIWLAAGTFAGAGTITANGGNAGNTNGGGGGGGKIAFTYTSKTYNGTVTAYGGSDSAGNNDLRRGGAGTIYDNGALTINNNSKASTRQTRTPAITITDLTLSNTGQLTLAADLTATGNVTLGSGTTVTPLTRTLTVGGNFSNSGTFTAGTSTVVFNTAGTTSTVAGSTTFYNLSCTTAGKNITFTAGTTQTISNALTLTGSTGSNIVLRSSSAGSYWNINPQGTRSVSFVDVKDSNNNNASAITASDTIDSGHNVNWTITSPAPSNPTINNYDTGAYIGTNTPALSFNLSDPNSLDVKYQIQIDDNADYSSPVANVTEGSFSASPRNGVTYTPSALADGSYYWKVQTINSGSASSGYVTANSGAVAFIVDTTGPTSPSVNINTSATYATSRSATLALSASDAGVGVSDMMISEDSGFSGASWESYATSKSFTLSASDGTKTVYAKFRDSLGNVSSTTSDTIILDTTAPSGTITINSGDAYTTSTSVTLGISASDAGSGMSEMEISEDSGFSGASWESYATSAPFTLTGLDGTHTVYIRFKDAAGNISLATTDTIVLDTVAPTGSISINSGATNANSRTVTLSISALDSTAGVDQMEVSESATFVGASYEAFAASKSFTLTASDGTHTVYVRFMDAAGNVSSTYSDTIVLDRSGPIVTEFNINADAAYATSADVTLTIGAMDITTSVQDMMVSESASFVGGVWESYATSKAITLSAGDGSKTVYIKFRDAAGNSSLPTFDMITLDTNMPDGSITINAGDGYTQLDDVTLTLSASDNLGSVSLMRVSEDSSFDGIAWESYATSKAFTLSASDGTKTVYAEFQDDAGNTSGVVSDAITYDTTAPVSNSVVINSADVTTSTPNVTLALSSSDATSGTLLMQVSESATFVGASWEAFAVSAPFTLSDGDGTRTLYARFQDAAGNITSGVSDTITLDTASPVGLVTINDGDSITSVRNVTLTLTANDVTTDVAEMQVSESSSFVGASWEAFAVSKSFMLSSVDGVKTVYARFKDDAGNISTSVNDTIEYDSTAPGIASFSINSDATYSDSRLVTLSLSGSDSGGGIYQMMIDNSPDFSAGVWEPYDTSKSWTLSSGDGAKTVYVKLRDTVLNVSETAEDAITLDATDPTGSIAINTGDSYTSSRIVTATLSASDATSGIVQMMISDSASFTGASWEDYATTRSYTLSETDGVKTLYAKFKDNAGNVSSTVSDTIIQDTSGPTSNFVKINNNATYTNSRNVDVQVSASDAQTSVASVMISMSNTFLLATWEPYTTELPLTLTSGDGVKTVYVKFKDTEGNVSSVSQASITLDTTAPTGSISISAGAAKTVTRDVILTLAATDGASGVATMQISESPTLASADSAAFATSKSFTLSDGEGTKTVYVRYMDDADNASSIYSDSITFAVPRTDTEESFESDDSGPSGSPTSPSSPSDDNGGSSSGGSNGGGGTNNNGGNGGDISTTSITIRVLDDSNQPVANATVTLEDGTVGITDENGLVTFRDVAEGTKKVKIEYGDTVEEKEITVSKDNAEVAVNINQSRISNFVRNKNPYVMVLAGAVVLAGGFGIVLRIRRARRKRY